MHQRPEAAIKLSIVVPTYNEVGNIEPLVRALEASLHGNDFEVIICDDDSPDLTWARAEQIGRQHPCLRVLRRTRNRGLGPAVVDGFSVARGEAVACIDADLQHDPMILPEMLSKIRAGYDLVVGSRYVRGGGTGNWNFLRRLESSVATKLAQKLLKINLHDPMSGYFMLRREDFLRVRGQLNAEGFKILLEIATHVKPHRLAEVPYVFRRRERGESKLDGKVVLAYLRQLWRLSILGRLIPSEFLKFVIVGGSGVLVNLTAMAILLRLTSYRDWRASALASMIATVNNYILNNFWTFRDRSHIGITLVRRYLWYLLASLVGLGLTTVSYAAITGALFKTLATPAGLPTPVLLFCQFLAILVGVFSNYLLNRSITWPKNAYQECKELEPERTQHVGTG